MTTFIISGSFDRNLGPIPLGSYKAAVYGSISIDDTGRNPIAALYNASTGSITLNVRQVRVSISPNGTTHSNDVCFLLGSMAFGSVSGSAFVPTALNPSYPASVAIPYRATITGPTIHDPMNGFLVQAQAQNLGSSPNPPILVADINAQTLDRDRLTIAPGSSYVVTLTEVINTSENIFSYVTEFTWDEEA